MTVGKRLDRESVRTIQLRIVARDHGYPQHSAEIAITINIIDVNDNAPKFQQSIYNASIEENQPEGTVVAHLSAHDDDYGMNLGYCVRHQSCS